MESLFPAAISWRWPLISEPLSVNIAYLETGLVATLRCKQCKIPALFFLEQFQVGFQA